MMLTRACAQLLGKIKALKIDLWVELGKLRFQAPQNTIDDTLKQEIAEYKSEILGWLEEVGQNLQSSILPAQEEKDGMWPLAKEQKVFWHASKLAESDHVYNIPYAFILNGDLDIVKFKYAIEKLYLSERMFRVKFTEKEGKIYQYINQDDCSVPLTIGYLEDDKSIVREHCKKLAETDFKIESAACIIFDIQILSSKKNLFTMVLHHIIADGASIDLILTRLKNLYFDCNSEVKSVDFLDYSIAESQLSENKEVLQEMVRRYQTLPDLSVFPYDKGTTKTDTNMGGNYKFALSESLSTAVRCYAKQANTSLYVLLLAGYFALLRKYARSDQQCVGISISTRNTEQKQGIIGPILETGALLVDARLNESFETLVAQVSSVLMTAIEEAQKTSFSDFLMELKKNHREVGQIFNSIFLLEPANSHALELGNCTCEAVDVPLNFSKFDLTFFLRDTEGVLTGNIEYKTDLFTIESVAEIASHYESILKNMIANPARKLGDCNLIVKNSHKHNQSSSEALSILQRIFTNVKDTPEKVAIYDQFTQISYAHLWGKASCLAKQVCNKAKGPYVGVLLERSVESVVAMLAILLAKKAFVPIDSENPEERIHYIVGNANLDCVIVSPDLMHLIPNQINQLTTENLVVDESEYLCPELSLSDNAYMIYTSGSTGKPKGVRVNHTNIAHYVEWAVSAYFNSHQVNHALVHSSIAFDLTITGIFPPLANGGQVFIPRGFGVEVLTQYITEHKNLGLIKLTPSHLRLVKNSLASSIVEKTGVIVVGGEAFYARDALELLEGSPELVFINEYGPTEATVGCMQFVLSKENIEYFSANDPVPIGKAIDGMNIEVLDQSNQFCPCFIPGEICISGDGVSDGYFDHEDLTNEKFEKRIDDSGHSYKIYRSGDLAYVSDTGDLIYVGRIDEQIKINGYRIEIGEINNILAISESVHIAETSIIDNQLVSYIVAKPQAKLDTVQLQAHARSYLPFYMRPEHYIFVEKIPLTVNGKLDVKELPKPEYVEETDDVLPKDSLEAQLLVVWTQILGNHEIGVKDDFFRIGGDSILSIQLTSELRKQGFDCNIRTIFDTRTIEVLAQYIRSAENNTQLKFNSEAGQLIGAFELLPIQQWFFDQSFVKPNHFNHAFLVRVPQLDLNRLMKTMQQLVKHHDVLRMQYSSPSESEQNYSQEYAKQVQMPELVCFDRTKVNDHELKQQLTKWQNGFDILKGPLWKIGYITGYADNSARLFFALHHLIVDSVSWRILIEDTRALYEGKKLAKKTSSYRQWVKAVRQYCEKSPEDAQYWQSVVQDQSNIYPAAIKPYHEHVIKFDESLTKALLTKSNQSYRTEINDLLLTTLAYALKVCTGSAVNHITLEGHGREVIEADLDLSRTVGWFTTMYPVKLELQQDIESSIKAIKEALRNIPTKGLSYGAFRYFSTSLENVKLPPISFNYLGQFKNSSAAWQVVNESAGSALDANNWGKNLLDINGFIADDRLQFNIGSTLNDETTNRFIEEFKARLEQLIMHCVDKVEAQQFSYTPSDFPTVRLSQNLLDQLQIRYQIQAIYPANSLQQGFIYHALSHPHDDAYRVQIMYDYYCELNLQYYYQAWNEVVKVYPALRTCFNWEEEVVQVICRAGCVAWKVHDISQAEDQEEALNEIQLKDRQQAFDLGNIQLLRVHVIKRGNDHYTILKSEHHAISDGWSNAVVFAQLHKYYLALLSNRPITLHEDQAYLNTQDYYYAHQQQTQSYWAKRLNTTLHANDLSRLFTTTTDLSNFTKVDVLCEHELTLTVESTQLLKHAAAEAGVTLNLLCQFAWHKLLHVYTQDLQTIVGTTISGRSLPVSDIGKSVGLYINTLPFIIDWSQTGATILKQLKKMHQDMTEMDSYGYVQLSHLRQQGAPRFHNIFVFENYPGGQSSSALKFKFKHAIEKLDVPIALIVYEENKALHFKLKYSGELISSTQARRIMMQFRRVLLQLPNGLQLNHSDLSLMGEDEYKKVVYNWNDNESAYPKDQTIYEIFEVQVQKTPDHIAVVFEDQQLSYLELNQKGNRLARLIRARYKKHHKEELKPDTLICLCVNRSIDMIIGILGILKAGAAYVPLDPDYPQDRLQFMIDDSYEGLIITQEALLVKDSFLAGIHSDEILIIDSAKVQSALENESVDNLETICGPADLAYVIYTSGSTGRPKGVLLEHHNVVRLFMSTNKLYHFNDRDVWTLFHSYAFDFSVWEIWGALLYGGKLIIVSQMVARDPVLFYNLICQQQVSVLNQTPEAFRQLIHIDSQKHRKLETLRFVVFGGDALNIEMLRTWWKKYSDHKPQLVNMYGITETTVHVTHGVLTQQHLEESRVGFIGKQIQDLKAYVLDQYGQVCPVGVIGELHIGGAGLARGYLKQDKLTHERFIANPFSNQSNQPGTDRIYKTGDLVRWLADGNLEYHGRTDFQVKIRGYRIELGEIENVLEKNEAIYQACVVAKDKESQKYLVAYYVLESDTTALSIEQLREYLLQILPGYMMPSAFVVLEEMPLTSNAKVNRKALPEPDMSLMSDKYLAPRNEVERVLANIWAAVLTLDQIGIDDDFYFIGGHSIAAMQITHKINQQLGCRITIADLLQYRTIANISAHCSTQQMHLEINAVAEGESVELSFAQQRLWFIEGYEGGSAAYNVPFYLELSANIDLNTFKQAIQSVVSRHEVLRTVFVQDEHAVDYQRVLTEALKVSEKEICSSQLLSELKTAAYKVFDLRKPYPISVSIYHTQTKSYAAVIFHHIAFDGWSTGIFFRELNAFYQQLSNNIPLDLPALKIQYKDFSSWQRQYLYGERLKQEISYWENTLNGMTTLDFPADKPRPKQIDYSGGYVYYPVPTALSKQLKTLARSQGTTLCTLMLSAFYVLLHRYTHQDDLLIGTVVANRQDPALENLIGFFVNSLPLRMQLKNDVQFNQLVEQVHELMLQAQMHQVLPFEKIVESLNIEKDPSRHPIFQIMFGMHNFDDKVGLHEAPFEFMPTDDTYKVSKFDLSLFIDDRGKDLIAVFNYATSLFEKEIIEKFAKHYGYILEQIVANSAQSIAEIRALDDEEIYRIINGFNCSRKLQPAKKTIHNHFELIADKNPNRIALVYQEESLSYGELNDRANKLSRHILNTYQSITGDSLKPDTLIAICLEKGFDLLIGTLAILKAGGAYVPIDSSSPKSRIRFILEETQSCLLLTQETLEKSMKITGQDDVTLLLIDQFDYHAISNSNLSVPMQATNLAYVIYTSGTTAKPNGVMIEHNGVVDLAVNTSQFKFSEDDVMMFLSSPVFDAATFEIWGCLLNGAKLVIPKDEKELCSDSRLFKSKVLQHRISKLMLTKTLFDSLYVCDHGAFDSIDTLYICGEALDVNLINKLISQSNRPKRIINAYGPTESTTLTTVFDCQSVLDIGSVPIGYVIDQRQGYVLDGSLNPVPIGVVGEFYIGGTALARGYLNRPELDRERFITHQFYDSSEKKHSTTRLYRTGDLVKYRVDGSLVYVGRNDSQVKIRGYRIELGEIETRLVEHPQIKHAIVLVKERNVPDKYDDKIITTRKYIVAYYLSNAEINQDDLLAHLSKSLSNYMLPSYFVRLEMLPKTINGKLDVKALPQPELTFKNQPTYVEPRNDREQQMAIIWQEVLGVAQVGITDDFFRIGGDSIISIQLVSKLRDQGYPCSIKAIFEDRTIERLTKRLDHATTAQVSTQAEQGMLSGTFELLPIQKWFFEQAIAHRNHWNQAFLVKVPLVDTKKLVDALNALAAQHDILRLKFIKLNGRYQQHYTDKVVVPALQILDRHQLSDDALQEKLTQWQSDFNIEHGPLWKVGYISGYQDGSARLHFSLHHLIVDAVSWRILIEDIRRLYEGKQLSKKTSSYRQWVNAVNQYPQKHTEELLYWEQSSFLGQQVDAFNKIRSFDRKKYFGVAKLNKALTKQLLQDASYPYRTQINDLLLTALAYALKDLTSQNQVHITLEGHGREHIDESLDLSRTVGWFTTIYPIKLTIQNDLSRSIKGIKAQLKGLFNNGLGYSAFKYYESAQYLKRAQLPEVIFNYLGQFDSQDGLWQVVRENAGESMLDQDVGKHILNINGWVIAGELQFEIVACLAEPLANQFVAAFEDYLAEIVSHCMQKVSRDEVEYISDDFAWDERDLLLPEGLNETEITSLQECL